MDKEVFELFQKYRQHFGLSDSESLDLQAKFEEEFAKLICKYGHHDLGPDQCGKPEHDLCYQCNEMSQSLGFKRSDNWEKDFSYIRI